jgi:hypothetical protein
MRYLTAFAYCLVFFLTCPVQAQKPDFGRYHALVIGIDAYTDLRPLETAVNDASAVHELLVRKYGYESTLLLNPTRAKLLTALDKLRSELTENDNLLIFYAGHGYLDRQTGDGFWLPLDAKEDSQVAWISISRITHFLKATVAKHVLVIADSCYSGTLTRDAPVALQTGKKRQTELQRISRKRARKALTSGGLEPVVDGGGDGHSVFTRALLETLRDNKQILDGYQLFRVLRQKVVLNAEQTPQYSDVRLAGDEGGDYIFVPKGSTVVVVPPTSQGSVDERALDLAFWTPIQTSEDPRAYQAYLEKFPNGIYATLARLKLEKLKARKREVSPDKTPVKNIPTTATGGRVQDTGDTIWPSFQQSLTAGPSNSPIKAKLPEIAMGPVAQNTRPELAAFGGIWEGWMCRNRVTDVKIAIHDVSNGEATLTYASGNPSYNNYYSTAAARFDGRTLRGSLSNGAEIILAMRADGNMNIKYQQPENWCTGVLRQTKNLPTAMWRNTALPVPSYATVSEPGDQIAESAARFSGVWTGAWGGKLPSLLIVREVTSNSKATGIYMWGDHPEGRFRGGHSVFTAEIENDALFWANGQIRFRFEIQDNGSIVGSRYSDGRKDGHVVMKKAARR